MQVMVIMFGIIFGLCFAFVIPCISENKVMHGGKLLHISTKRNTDTEKTNTETENDNCISITPPYTVTGYLQELVCLRQRVYTDLPAFQHKPYAILIMQAVRD